MTRDDRARTPLKNCSGCKYFSSEPACCWCHRPVELGGSRFGSLPIDDIRCEHYSKSGE